MKPTHAMHDLGQSLWLDNITRDFFAFPTLPFAAFLGAAFFGAALAAAFFGAALAAGFFGAALAAGFFAAPFALFAIATFLPDEGLALRLTWTPRALAAALFGGFALPSPRAGAPSGRSSCQLRRTST